MFYEVLSWQACKDNAEDLRALIAADNFDAGFALGQTEMHLLQNLRRAIVVARPPPGQSVLDVVRDQVMATSGQQWEESDVLAFFQCAKVLGEEHLEFLAEVVDTHVNVARIAVRPADFASAAALPASVPWLKVALLAAQHMSPEQRWKKGPRGRAFGSSIEKPVWERLKKATPQELAPAEAFVRAVLDRYRLEALPGVSREAGACAIPGLFVRVATAVALSKDLSDLPNQWGRVESRAREYFPTVVAVLPAPVAHGASGGEKQQTHGASCGAQAAPADEAPALTFVDGKLVPDMAATAPGAGFLPGAAVRCVVAHPGVEVNMVGVVDRIVADRVWIRWEVPQGEKSLVPCDNLDYIKADAKPPAGAGVPKKLAAAELAAQEAQREAEARASLPTGTPWTATVLRDTEDGVAAMVTGLLWQLHQVFHVSAEDLVWSTCPASGASLCHAQQKFKAGRLVLIPWPAQVVRSRPEELPDRQLCLPIALKFSTTSAELFLVGPRPREVNEQAPTPSGPVKVVFPFWDIIQARPTEGKPLQFDHELVDMPLHAYSPGKALLCRKGATKRTLQARIPFWTNPEDVQIGQRLFVDAKVLPCAVASVKKAS